MIRNFLFHRVNPERDKLWDPMDVALFDKCIAHISKHYEVKLFEELAFTNELHIGKNIATIMFDDGYKDNLQYAAPILAKYNCKASFYVVTDSIDHNIPTWTHLLEHHFQHTQLNAIDMDFPFLSSDLRVKNLASPEARIAYVGKLKPYLKKLEHSQRQQVLNRVTSTYSDVPAPKIMMDWNEVRQLKNAGHYIGSHTVTHCMLGTMLNEAEVLEELTQSGRRIEQELGYFPLTISYPVGSYNATTVKLAKQAGYKIGLAVKQQLYNPSIDDIFEVPRIELYNEPWWKTRLRISHLLERIKQLIKYR